MGPELIKNSSCAILAGGRASRMGGADKAMLKLGEKTFLQHALDAAEGFGRIIISTNGSYELPFEQIPDIHPGLGPMGALEAVLSACETDTLMVIPCDTPLIKQETIFRMFNAFAGLSPESGALVLRCEGRVYPTIAIYRKAALPAVCAAIESGNYRMMRLLDSIGAVYLDTEDSMQLTNVNTPQDLEVLEALIKTK